MCDFTQTQRTGLDTPSPARMYDYFLGGVHNTGEDRRLAEQVATLWPDVIVAARCNRAFLRRAVHFVLAQGIDQFLDLGSGIPTVGNVHELVVRANPAARVVYVDSDPVAVTMSQQLLSDQTNVVALQADICQPAHVLEHPAVRRLLDFRKPMALLMVAVLQFIPNTQDARAAVKAFCGAMPAGSYLVMSHGIGDGVPLDTSQQLRRLYDRSTKRAANRAGADIEPFFSGLTLVEPGLVFAPLWRPEGPQDLLFHEPERSHSFVAVARKDE